MRKTTQLHFGKMKNKIVLYYSNLFFILAIIVTDMHRYRSFIYGRNGIHFYYLSEEIKQTGKILSLLQ